MANNSDIEIWKDIPNYEGCYQASNLGNIRSLDRVSARGHNVKGRVLSKSLGSQYYYTVALSKDGKPKTKKVHMLVAMAFLGHTPCGYKIVIDHIDHDPLNNKVDNLQLITNRENLSKDRKGYSSKYIGVSICRPNSWQAAIQYKGDNIYLGTFKEELDASNSYQKALENIKNGLAPK
jgi:hypothetical protein